MVIHRPKGEPEPLFPPAFFSARRALFPIVAYTILASCTLFFSEWLFHVTKPSFLTTLTLAQKLAILAIAPLPLTLAALVVVSLLTTPILLIHPKKTAPFSSFLVPAFILTGTQLLLIDLEREPS